MQAAKDTFLKTLASRLALVNPARTVMMDGATRPAVVAVENETPLPADTVLEAFLLNWAGAGWAMPEGSLMYVDCRIVYGSQGSDAMMRADRGRILTAMDRELLQVCEPRWTEKFDYTQTPAVAMGSNIFWGSPVMEAASDAKGILQRTATVRVFFFAEVA